MDIGLLESVQRRMTKIIEGIRNFSYERRLKLLKLHSLGRHRVRGDLIEVFKWMKGFNKSDVGKVLTINSQEKFRFRKNIDRNWFTNRVVDDWTRLSQQIVSAQTIGSFKRRFDCFMDGDEMWM